MGYTTGFDGEFNLQFRDEKSKEVVTELVNGLAKTRRVTRDLSHLVGELDQPINYYGVDGEFYHGDENSSIINNNEPPRTQPGLWLQWVIEEDSLYWDEGEKFYNYVEWLQYLIDKIFKPNDVIVNGKVEWFGEECDDTGEIIVTDNTIVINNI